MFLFPEPGYNLHTFVRREIWGWAKREGRRWYLDVEDWRGVIHQTGLHRTEAAAVAAAGRWVEAQGHVLDAPGPDLALVGAVVRRVEEMARGGRR